jgi:hypothetical protein
MLKFLRDKHRVTVDPMSLTLSPLMEIWRWDSTEDKVEATKLLTYIHLVSQVDQSAPYARANPDEIEGLVKREVWGTHDRELPAPYTDEVVETIIFHYQSAYESAEDASVRAMDKKIFEIKKIVEETDVVIRESITRGAVTFVSNYPLISKMMQEMVKIIKTRDEMKSIIIKQTSRDNLKGQKKLSFLDKRRRELKNEREENPTTEEPIGL